MNLKIVLLLLSLLFPVIIVDQVNASSYFPVVDPQSITIEPGSCASFTLTFPPTGGFTDFLALSTTAPAGLSTALTDAGVLVGPGGPTVTGLGVCAEPSSLGGRYEVLFCFRGTGGFPSCETLVVWISDFSLSSSLPARPFQGTLNTSVIVTGTNGFIGRVTLTGSIAPSTGLACALNPDSVNLTASRSVQLSTLSCTGSIGQQHNVTIAGTSGPVIRMISLSISARNLHCQQTLGTGSILASACI